ncbi:PREDICTED: transmembrane protein 92-like [Elephantulus edwardii]|uniref:transmembrane protein 92-like n=1 Tax=Elephantulus edwardii TaxID=28737 RepID=UPI0003F08EC6|nr:PREDICTED: transmembrane protein 92-like [Elephantulus edwardii]
MVGPWIRRLPPALLLCLLASLHQVSAKCDFLLICPNGLKCCGDRCCKDYDVVTKPLIVIIFFVLMLFILFVVVLAKYLRENCMRSEDSSPPMAYLEPISALYSSVLPQETRIYASELPPPYNEIMRMPFMGLPPIEPPPPYSVRPEEYPGVQEGIINTTF